MIVPNYFLIKNWLASVELMDQNAMLSSKQEKKVNTVILNMELKRKNKILLDHIHNLDQ